MSVKITVYPKIDLPKNIQKIENPQFWLYGANEWHRLISPFTPMDTGNLDQNVTVTPKKIQYNMPYSTIVYDRNANFRKDQHPLASKEWDKAAIAAGKDKELIATLQDYVNSGKLDLNG